MSRILWGICFIIIGIIIGTNSFGLTNINIFFDGWWTLFIIVPCFIGLFNKKELARINELEQEIQTLKEQLNYLGAKDYVEIQKEKSTFFYCVIKNLPFIK